MSSDGGKRCIFCPHVGKLTDEHIWGDWTRQHVPRPHKKHEFEFVSRPEPGKEERAPKRVRAGDPLNSQVKIVCARCNSGWMGRIQENTKPYLVPLFNGIESILDTDAQTKIATWATMATITGEYLGRRIEKTTFTLQERDWFRRNKRPFDNIRVWIGFLYRPKWNGQWVHVTMPILASKNFPGREPKDVARPNLQTTTFVVGKLYVHTMSAEFPEVVHGWDWRTDPGANVALTQIWPIQYPSVFWPVREVTNAEAESFSTAFMRYSDDLAIRKGWRRNAKP